MTPATPSNPTSPEVRPRRLPRRAGAVTLRLAPMVAMAGLLAGTVALAAGPASASAARPAIGGYTFRTVNNSNDPTFNQLLGINNKDKIVGYFGSGAKNHPNKGYQILPPYKQADFRTENFPHSKQTQVIGVNDHGITVGFWSTQNKKSMVDNNFGFYSVGDHVFRKVDFPTTNNSKPPVNQLLGVNNNDIAVGFYNDSKGNSHGYTYNIKTHTFRVVHVPGATSVTAAGINGKGSIAGFFTNAKGKVEAFFLRHTGQLFKLAFHGASMTQAFGVNDKGEVVGAYMVGSATHGFTWTIQHGFKTVDDPNGVGTTTLNGVNNAGDLVGFYVDSRGNTDGLLAKPAS